MSAYSSWFILILWSLLIWSASCGGFIKYSYRLYLSLSLSGSPSVSNMITYAYHIGLFGLLSGFGVRVLKRRLWGMRDRHMLPLGLWVRLCGNDTLFWLQYEDCFCPACLLLSTVYCCEGFWVPGGSGRGDVCELAGSGYYRTWSCLRLYLKRFLGWSSSAPAAASPKKILLGRWLLGIQMVWPVHWSCALMILASMLVQLAFCCTLAFFTGVSFVKRIPSK